MGTDIYAPNFSVEGAKELISSCLDKFDKENPDSLLLLETISKLTLMINTAKFDYTVLENLISENAALGDQYDALQLKQISSDITHLSFRANALQDKCEGLKKELSQTEYPHSVLDPAASPDPRIPNSLAWTKLGTSDVNLKLQPFSAK